LGFECVPSGSYEVSEEAPRRQFRRIGNLGDHRISMIVSDNQVIVAV
jgi:hypothetical protein